MTLKDFGHENQNTKAEYLEGEPSSGSWTAVGALGRHSKTPRLYSAPPGNGTNHVVGVYGDGRTSERVLVIDGKEVRKRSPISVIIVGGGGGRSSSDEVAGNGGGGGLSSGGSCCCVGFGGQEAVALRSQESGAATEQPGAGTSAASVWDAAAARASIYKLTARIAELVDRRAPRQLARWGSARTLGRAPILPSACHPEASAVSHTNRPKQN
ncbi:hypothetical protein AXG93_4343s1640 [Marchantia polymorpha subsp. ruderalis]|uniref:Uncharacterized protein n=1 Tax=Marchantia polymorpha subsp. ruderalis TaxID=1480154 RepID=A0A176VUB4_MARPO|nr:hypothetical protein AXG93_4343s1640 [Marchantia polymorpha subsp. ruderalis]